jgi:death-on-curing protein
VRYVGLELAVAVVKRRGWGPVRDLGLLDSALARPAASAFGRDAYPSLPLKAAALMHSLAGNHALVDGNKRMALHLTHLFVHLNGCDLTMSQDEAFNLVMDVAKGLDDLPEIASRLGVIRRP